MIRISCAPGDLTPSGTGCLRPIVGILLAITAAFVGMFYSPTGAVLIFRVMLGYDAWESRSVDVGSGTSRAFAPSVILASINDDFFSRLRRNGSLFGKRVVVKPI